MSVNVTVNGTSFPIPQTSEVGWGARVTAWIQAISANTLQKSGGTFTLSADANFGGSFGLNATYYKSGSANIAGSGTVRLANGDFVAWRNAGNTADIALGAGSSDAVPAYGGVDLVTVSGTQTLTNKTISGASNTLTNIPNSATTAASANTASAIVARDGSGNIAASQASLATADINGIFLDGNASALPTSPTYDTYGSIQKTSGSGTGDFASAGSIVYRARLSSVAGRSSHLFYTGATPTKVFSIDEAGKVIIGASGGTQTHALNGNTVNFTSSTAGSIQVMPNLSASAGIVRFTNPAASGLFNWQVGAHYNSTNSFEITPSTAVDGSTYNAPVFKASSAGVVTIGATSGTQVHLVNGSVTTSGDVTLGNSNGDRLLNISVGTSGTNKATVRMGTGTREWETTVAASPYTWSLNYVGTDTPNSNIITATKGGLVTVGVSGGTQTHVVNGNLSVTGTGRIQALSTAGAVMNDASGNLSSVAPSTSGNVMTSNGSAWVSQAKAAVTIQKFVAASGTFTGNTSSGSPTISAVSSFTGLVVGMSITGTGIPASAYITAINSGASTITISANATATGTGVTLTQTNTGTYVLPSPAPLYLRVRVLGGGGGGAGSAATGGGNGGAGGNSTFGTSLLTANGGGGGVWSTGTGGAGGTASIVGTSAAGIAVSGQNGLGVSTGASVVQYSGAPGGSSALGGGGTSLNNSAGNAGVANSGSGGGGGGTGGTTGFIGAGGGAGGFVDAIVSGTLATTYGFTVGSGGTTGTSGGAGFFAGGAGAGGIIVVEEHFQ